MREREELGALQMPAWGLLCLAGAGNGRGREWPGQGVAGTGNAQGREWPGQGMAGTGNAQGRSERCSPMAHPGPAPGTARAAPAGALRSLWCDSGVWMQH